MRVRYRFLEFIDGDGLSKWRIQVPLLRFFWQTLTKNPIPGVPSGPYPDRRPHYAEFDSIDDAVHAARLHAIDQRKRERHFVDLRVSTVDDAHIADEQ